MQYHKLGNTGMTVSEIGLGGEYLEGKEPAVVEQVVRMALDASVNLIDIFMSEPNVRTNIGNAVAGRRDKVIIQGHLRAVWRGGQYARSLDMAEVKPAFEDLLARLQTDYIDIGTLHMIDNERDYDAIFNGPIYAYAQQLKRDGVIRAIGMSCHNPHIALKAVEQGLIDVLFFSLNPAYDLLEQSDKDGPAAVNAGSFETLGELTIDPAREKLYRLCAQKGVGITVMKSLAAGALLDAKTSPFGAAMTPVQCIHYALTRPAVASVLVGMQRPGDVEAALAYETADDAERDYAHIFRSKPQFSLRGHCMYCNHCLPCPSHIDIARVNQYLDLAEQEGVVSPTVRAHYEGMNHTAQDCIACGACVPRCPFGVPVVERMKKAKEVFGK